MIDSDYEIRFWDRQNRPITLEEWGEKFSDLNYKILQVTPIGEDSRVITAWLGTDDEFNTPPRIFGTIIKTGSRYHDEQRTTTEQEALAMHATVCSQMS